MLESKLKTIEELQKENILKNKQIKELQKKL